MALRKKGFSIKSIAKQLGVSKSSVSVWCRDIVLTKKQLDLIKSNMILKSAPGRLIGAMMNKNKRLDAIAKFKAEGSRVVGNISEREITLIGAALYWAEGAKTLGRFTFVNSNPDMIMFMYKFLTNSLKIAKSEIKVGIQINSIHEHRIDKVLLFWSKLLDLPSSQFDNPYYINVKPKKVYENMENYYGLVRLKVRKGTNLQYRILGLIDGIIEGIKK